MTPWESKVVSAAGWGGAGWATRLLGHVQNFFSLPFLDYFLGGVKANAFHKLGGKFLMKF